METQLPNADAESLQGLLNMSLGGGESNTKVNGSDRDPPLDIEFVEKILNYEFKNKSLLVQAFTDVSFESFDEKCDSYERLEHIGDAVLNLVITQKLYHQYPNSAPGELTNLRAANVNTEKLARVAVKYNLHRCLRHNKPLLGHQILEFAKAIEEYPLHSRGLLKVPKSLADIVESTIGALFIDCDSIDTVRKVIEPLLEPIITLETLENHPKTKLHEMCQKKNLKLRFEDTWENNKEILVFIEDHLVGRGHHFVKKENARNCAAKNAIENFPIFFQL